jgi:hypothetical protein
MITLKNGGIKIIIMKEYIAPLLRFGALILLLTTIYEQNNAINEYKAKASVNIDSLQNELFINQSNVGRYETALGLLSEEDSVAAKKFEDKLSETE